LIGQENSDNHRNPGFDELYRKMDRYVTISGKSPSTLSNYSRCLATMALHFNCSPLELDKEQILDYLEYLKTKSKTPSSSYFKHTVSDLASPAVSQEKMPV